MGRPEFPNCIMPVSVIRGVGERQEAYDKDPERYERREREKREHARQTRYKRNTKGNRHMNRIKQAAPRGGKG